MIRSVSPAAFAVLQGMRHRWPPRFPPPCTLLTDREQPAFDVPVDRAAWTGEHWQQYALHLERAGVELAEDACKLRQRLDAAQTSRRARRAPQFPDWLAPDWTPPRKPGRPIAASAATALAVLRNAAVTTPQGRSLSPEQMIQAWNALQPRSRRVAGPELPKVKAAMRRIRQAPHKYLG